MDEELLKIFREGMGIRVETPDLKRGVSAFLLFMMHSRETQLLLVESLGKALGFVPTAVADNFLAMLMETGDMVRQKRKDDEMRD